MKSVVVKLALVTAYVAAMLLDGSEASIDKEIATRNKRQLPLQTTCDLRRPGDCYKGDLIDTEVADCKKTSFIRTCDPINDDYKLSSVIDVPDVSKHGVDCVGDGSRPITCGGAGTDTRCVCDKAVDVKRIKSTVANQCRCQYWPQHDPRKDKPSYCTQYDNGGTTGVHFYICCNNCNDPLDGSCNKKDYQGGGSEGNYCGACGTNTEDGGGRETYSFNCVSCSQQSACEKQCNKKYGGIWANIPGFCPKWARCFRECCIEAEEELNAEIQALFSYG